MDLPEAVVEAVILDRSEIINFPVIGGSNLQRSTAFDSRYAYNWYPYFDSVTQTEAQYMYAGSKKVLDFNVGGNSYKGRPGGIAFTETAIFVIIGNILFEYDGVSATNIGTISSTTGAVSMAIAGNILTIVDGSGQWTYDITTGPLTPVTSPAKPTGATYVCEQQGFTLFNNDGTAFNNNTQTIIEGAQYNPSKFSIYNRTQINYKSSYLSYRLIAIQSINGRIICFTTGFIETLENEGKAGFTFRPDLNLTYGYGLLSSTALAKGLGGAQNQTQPEFLIFLSRNPDGTIKVMKTHGNPPQVISTPSIDYRLNQLEFPEDANAFLWTENGQTFFQCSWTRDNLTIVYNMTNDTWFDVGYRNGRHFAEAFVFFKGKRLVTSYLDNGLYELSEKYVTNDGEPITREIVTSNMRIKGYKRFTAQMLELYFQQGVGLAGKVLPDMPNYVYGASAQIFISTSYDGGQTFNQPIIASVGELARLQHVTRVTSLGTTRDLCFKIQVKQPIVLVLMGAMLTFTANTGSQ